MRLDNLAQRLPLRNDSFIVARNTSRLVERRSARTRRIGQRLSQGSAASCSFRLLRYSTCKRCARLVDLFSVALDLHGALPDEVAGYLPRSVLLSQGRDGFDGVGLVLELAFVLNDDVLAVRRARQRAGELGGFESA